MTGDNELVTQKVCRDVGLPVKKIVTGAAIAGNEDEQFWRSSRKGQCVCAADTDPEGKVIQALASAGHVVGYMGDGINDALAMKAADVGISVDTAVDVAKESADIVLLEKSLQVLEDGIIEGRKVFGNIIKYIHMGAARISATCSASSAPPRCFRICR